MSPVVGIIPAVPPLPAQATHTLVQRRANPAPFGWQVRTVRAGDTLGAIAIAHRTTVGVLFSRNRFAGDGRFIAVGRQLWVPRTAPAPRGAARRAVAGPRTTSHVVRAGETLGGIAARVGVPTASLLKSNALSLQSVLQIGQRLKVVSVRKVSSANTFAGRTYSAKIVNSAAANRAYLAGRHVPSRTQTRAMIVATARRHGVDPRLALAISWQESGWNQRQVSVANAIGAMQVIPSSGVWASELVGRRLNLLNTQDNISAGVIILRSLSRSARTLNEAIAGYYQGLYSVQNRGMYADTRQYVAAILHHKTRM